jgi:hypothetical protein
MTPLRLVKNSFMLLAFLPFAAAGCGDDGGDDDDDDDDDDIQIDGSIDSSQDIDAAPDIDAPVADIDASLIDAAPAGNFDCLGDPLPDTAPDTVLLSGQAFTVSLDGQEPVAGANVEAFTAADVSLGTDTSDGTGAFSISVATGGDPVDGYLLATANTYIDTYLYPPYPIAADVDNASALLVSSENFALLPILAGTQQPDGQGFVGVVVVDCNNEPVMGAVVTTIPEGVVRYTGESGVPVAGPTSTNADGLAVVFDVDPGNVIVDATVQGMSLREHTVEVRADVVTTTIVAP